MSSHTPTSYDVDSCHRHVTGIHIYQMNSSSIVWQFPLLLEQCLESIWVLSGVSSTSVYQMVWWWYGSLNFVVKLKRIVLHTNVKFSEKLVPRTCAQNVRDHRQRILRLSFWHCSVDMSCWSSVLCWLLWKSFHVDEHQEFHQTSFCFPIALKASLLLMCI
jgi:hypothetical protein